MIARPTTPRRVCRARFLRTGEIMSNPEWVIPIELVDAVLEEGLGEDVPPDERAFWHAT